MFIRVQFVLAAVLLSLLSSTPAQAAATLYTDQSTFLSQLQPRYYLETFDSQPTHTVIDSPISFSGNGYSYNASAAGNFYNLNNGSDVWLSADTPDDAITLTFTGNPVTAIGANLFSTNTSNDAINSMFNISLSDGTNENLLTTPTSFTGFTSTVPITSITFTPRNLNAYPTLNNLYVGAVPEPASISIMLLAASTGLLHRRRA